MAGQKRTRSGDIKPPSHAPQIQPQPQDTTMTDTPPCGQAQPPSSKSSTSNTHTTQPTPSNPTHPTSLPQNPTTTKTKPPTNTLHNHTKRPPLPPHTTLTKRPLLRPAHPTPYSSSSSPKTLYLTTSSPFIPTIKRIRTLLSGVQKRSSQSQSTSTGAGSGSRSGRRKTNGHGRLEANGRLGARDVEASIASAAHAARTTQKTRKGKVKGGNAGPGSEEVFIKASGRAIPRALEIGVYFQGEEDCRVRVEMGSVKAIDDIEVQVAEGLSEGEVDEDVPETRVRTLSTVTVCIGLV